ncbi:MAG: hypothetical protein KAY37_02040 [Phycisphaerae bacterium]|nr:hypothetical protein [Phycisphaerae bacterium]
MKVLIVLLVIIVAAAIGGYFYVQHAGSQDPGQMVNYALGSVVDDQFRFDLEVSKAMVEKDPPPGGAENAANSTTWINEHFALRDASGQSVPLTSCGTSTIIGAHRGSEPEFFVTATIIADQTYTAEYTPNVAAGKRYRHTFTVPRSGEVRERLFFKLAEEG